MPGARFPKLRQNLNKFYELCGENDSQAGRRLGIKPQQLNEWRKGDDVPTRAAREHIAARLGVSVRDLLHGDVADAAAARDGPRLSNKAQKLLRKFEQLLEAAEKTKNQRVLQHFDFERECIEKAVSDKGDKTREGKNAKDPDTGVTAAEPSAWHARLQHTRGPPRTVKAKSGSPPTRSPTPFER